MSEQLNIIDLFLRAADEHPERTAIIYKGQSVSFGNFKREIVDTAAFFTMKGITAGDRVLVFVPMSIDLYRIALALFYIGATAVFLDEWVSKKRLEECCKIAQCKAFVGIWKVKLLAWFSPELRKIPVKLGLAYKKNAPGIQKYQTTSADTALITFTTGTTGTPKAAKRTQGFLKEQFDALIEKIQPRDGEIDMPALPIVLMINLGAGCTSVIADFKASKPEEIDIKKIWQQILDFKVERIVSSPFFIKKLAEHVTENHQVSSLKKIFTGGAPVFPSEAAMFLQAFPNTKIEIVYGSTEAEPISAIEASELVKDKNDRLVKGLPVGKIYRKANVRIIKIISEAVQCDSLEDLDAITLADGNIGEIIVSGPHVLREYFNNQQALLQNKIFIGTDCWHRTGDSGSLIEGNLYLTGRAVTLIEHKGELLSPFIWQNYLQSFVGVHLGTIVKKNNGILAVLELNKGADRNQVIAQIKEQSNPFDDIVIIPAIPRDPRHHSRIDYDRLLTAIE